MDSAAQRRHQQASRKEVAPSLPAAPVPAWAELPFILALFLAPLLAGGIPPFFPSGPTVGTQDPLPALLLGCLIWIGFLLRVLAPGAPPLSRPRAGWLALLFPVLAAATFFRSANPGGTLITTVLYASYAALAWLTADTVRRGGAGRIFGALLAGGFIAAGLGLQEYLKELKGGNSSWRAFGFFTNPNFFAGYLAPSLLLTLGQAFRIPAAFKAGTWNLVLGLLTVVLTGALVTTGSRGAILALAAGTALFLAAALFRSLGTPGEARDRAAWIRVGTLLALAVVTMAALSGPLRQREGSGTAPAVAALPAEICPQTGATAAEDSNRFRRYTWASTLAMGRARPLLGWGAGSFDTVFSHFARAGYTKHAHNSYLQLFAEEGAGAPLLWIALLGTAAWGLVRAPRSAAWSWAPGALGALAANAVHNLFDSLLFVPAIALLLWVLIGSGLACCGESGGASVPRAAPARFRWLAAGVGLFGLLLTAMHAAGRALLAQGQGETTPLTYASALRTLSLAQQLLPWDYQVAVQQSRATRFAGIKELQRAIDHSQRVIRLTPERPPSYLTVGFLREAQGDRLNAMYTYRVGLEHAPDDVELLYALAVVQDRLGFHKEALESYRKIVQVEQSPVQRVRAIADFRDWRYPRARVVLAREAELAGRKEEALAQRKAAACFLAERRLLETASPYAYTGLGDWDWDRERELRGEEEQLWHTLSEEYRRRGENRLSGLCADQAAAVQQSRDSLEKLIEAVQR